MAGKLTGFFEGEFLGTKIEERNGNVFRSMFLLSDMDSLKLSVRDDLLWENIKGLAPRKKVKVRAEVSEYKGNLYCNLLEVVA